MRKEMIFRVQMSSANDRAKALELVARIEGVNSMAIAGEDRSLLQVIGDGVDLNDMIAKKLRQKFGYAELLQLQTSGFLSAAHATTDELRVELNNLERTIHGTDEEPRNLKLSLLKYITGNFSEKLKIGHGGCGVVYKGILPNGGVVAVKKLLDHYTKEDNMFHKEVLSTMTVTHRNIVRFLGYCSHTEETAVKMEGIFVLAQIRARLLCFEYISNGSLESHITDELRGLEWHTRYQIIQEVCEGLHHLHNEKHIIHMDLKPANILLDDQMVPKITDFGVSRPDDKSQTMSTERLISLGYCSPEYRHRGKMSAKSDIYSLGMIILELVTGSKEVPSVTKVLRRWKHRWNKSAKDTPVGYKQVSKCLSLVKRCLHTDPADRPNIQEAICDLSKMDANATDEDINDATQYLELEDMLGIEPLEMHLPIELNKQISCSIELTNDTDDYFVFRISTTSLRPYDIRPTRGIVPPRSKCSVGITLQALVKALLHNQCKDEFSVQSTKLGNSLTATDIPEQMFDEVTGKVVDKVDLTIVLEPVMAHAKDQHVQFRHAYMEPQMDQMRG